MASLDEWFSLWHNFAPKFDVFNCHESGERVLLASGRERPEVLFQIPECAGQPAAATQPKMSAVPGLRNCCRQKANIITIKRDKP